MVLTPLERPGSVKVLKSVPKLLGLYGKAVSPDIGVFAHKAGAALGKKRGTASDKTVGQDPLVHSGAAPIASEALDVPAITFAARGVRIDPNELLRYQKQLGFPRTDNVPAGYTHIAAFPVAMALMVDPKFPLPLMGMVHLANRVEVARNLNVSEEFEVFAWAQNLAGHNKGTSVELVTEVQVSGEIIWRGISTYLAKGKFLKGRGAAAVERPEFQAPMPTGLWTLDSGTGRDYAGVSGDINPIHLSALSAKALGFPKAIAHGMYTASRALAEAGPLVGESFVWEVEFAKPVLLPAKVSVSITQGPKSGAPSADSAVQFLGWNAKKNQLHFSGSIRAL